MSGEAPYGWGLRVGDVASAAGFYTGLGFDRIAELQRPNDRPVLAILRTPVPGGRIWPTRPTRRPRIPEICRPDSERTRMWLCPNGIPVGTQPHSSCRLGVSSKPS
jgi:hypothetical protein